MKKNRTQSQNNIAMKSPKVNTQKNLSAIVAVALGLVTLFQAAAVSSNETNERSITKQESVLIAEIETMFLEETDLSIVEEVYQEVDQENIESVKVFSQNDELIAEGIPSEDESLRLLVNQADYLSTDSKVKYFRIS
jgi:hypothetical protein